MVKLIECPRDAMQGLAHFIPTPVKTEYLNQLLKVGFDTLDFGSFVSPKAIPQLRDTAEVLEGLDFDSTSTKLLAIVANQKGAQQAALFSQIEYIGYPLSVSETFQQRNTNRSIAEALIDIQQIQELCLTTNKTLVVYLSMGFGNPYGDDWSPCLLVDFTAQLALLGIKIIALSDTIGVANPSSISGLFSELIPAYKSVEFGAHLHTNPATWSEKIDAAFKAGCRRFDGALKGFGGCPMAKDELVGNMPTELMVEYFSEQNQLPQLIKQELDIALQMAPSVFNA